MAKPRPTLPPPLTPEAFGTVAIAAFTPTRWPPQSTRAPPLLPGLIAASVWIAPIRWCVTPSPGTGTYRSRALTIPEVTVLARPSGAPSATTGWPTCRPAEDPTPITGKFFAASDALTTARSVLGSRPTMVAPEVWPSLYRTDTVPPEAAGEMTWSLVRSDPPPRKIGPEPVPAWAPRLAEIVTTEGSTWFATGIAAHIAVPESARPEA